MRFTGAVLSLLLASSASAQETILDTVVASADHATLEAAVLAADSSIAGTLSDPMANLTLFAPDDDAFGTLPEGTVDLLVSAPWQNHLNCVLLGHVYADAAVPSSAITGPLTVTSAQEGYNLTLALDGMNVTVNEIPVSVPDINATNGVIHSLSEGVLLPSCVTENIVDVLDSDENFSTLVDLVTAADLGDALSGDPTPEGLTVMAPSNDAFAAVPAYILEYLSENVTALTEILTYHVISSNVFPTESTTVPTLNGDDIDVTVDGDAIALNGNSQVEGTELASNGVIHAISAVLVPPSLTLPDAPETVSPMPTMMTDAPEPTAAPDSTSGGFKASVMCVAVLTFIPFFTY
mmetsp:Transcript_6569/g.11986  ORF Transcript_6569/g.11986 Transcript_6569/m.11986 type:complete len:350 (-) Transcript_6569:2886-3935(-)